MTGWGVNERLVHTYGIAVPSCSLKWQRSGMPPFVCSRGPHAEPGSSGDHLVWDPSSVTSTSPVHRPPRAARRLTVTTSRRVF
eukprot:2201308-Prymnesium_polylepis.1